MPELPEVEIVRRGIEKKLLGQRITRVDVLDSRINRRSSSDFAADLRGQILRKIHRQGKWLFITLDSTDVCIVHLRMSGQLIINSKPIEHPSLRILIFLSQNVISYIDQRRFGEMFVLDRVEAISFMDRLGVDALTLTPAELRKALTGRVGSLKAALCNQALVAGIGNIYSDEALWRAQLRWDRKAGSLSEAEIQNLTKEIKQVLRHALKAGGTSAKDGLYVNTDGRIGWFAQKLAVYQREDSPCLKCGTLVQRKKLSSSSTYFCPRCQK